ncbi:O-antigen ligase family protein (plasmid) [Nostoc sp. UHCC 0302]|uniref:O-antigen ligase family protein n=1 Tax=Nostoc sp. UHCC 0302 TaxID=3134896 RepID=UPI00311CE029
MTKHSYLAQYIINTILKKNMRKILGFIEQGFTIISLLIYSGGPLTLIISGGANQADVEVTYDTSIIRIFYFLIYLVTFFLLLIRWRKVVYILNQDIFIWILTSLAVISIFWSFAPATTLKDGVALVGSSIFGIYLATRYSIKQQLQLLAYMFSLAIFLSIIFGLLMPHYGIMSDLHTGAWRGIYIHKNALGARMVTSTIVFLFLLIDNKKKYLLVGIGFFLGLSIVLLLLSKSTASIVNLVLILIALLIFKILRLRFILMIPVFICIAIAATSSSIWLMDNADALLLSIGKNPTLTGRTAVWEFVWDMIQKRPWLGYGYGGFWQGWDGESSYIWFSTGWNPTHPHNGLLALWLDLGLLGVLIYLIGFWRSLIRVLVWVRLSKTVESFWPVAHLTYIVIANISETTLLSSNSFVWILYISVACATLTPYKLKVNFHQINSSSSKL